MEFFTNNPPQCYYHFDKNPVSLGDRETAIQLNKDISMFASDADIFVVYNSILLQLIWSLDASAMTPFNDPLRVLNYDRFKKKKLNQQNLQEP